jgi:hypothetical protein
LSGLSVERLLSMGAFEGLRTLRRHAAEYGELSQPDLIGLIRKIDGDAGALDFDAAIELDLLIDPGASVERAPEFYRLCLEKVILVHRMSWARAVTRGRSVLIGQLTRDERQCFRSAHLLDDLPVEDVVIWWDKIAGVMRFSIDQEKRIIARNAERLTVDHELARLKKLGIDLAPKWVAIDDNGAGYDVLSYDFGDLGPVNRLIEVKSTVASPLRFFLSRNEWETANKFGEAYHFHIWHMSVTPPRLHERDMPQIQPHIPTDNESGKWTVAEIPLGAG